MHGYNYIGLPRTGQDHITTSPVRSCAFGRANGKVSVAREIARCRPHGHLIASLKRQPSQALRRGAVPRCAALCCKMQQKWPHLSYGPTKRCAVPLCAALRSAAIFSERGPTKRSTARENTVSWDADYAWRVFFTTCDSSGYCDWLQSNADIFSLTITYM